MKQKFFAALCAAVLTVCPLTGCGAESSAEPETLSMQDLPYGSTLTEDSAHDITAAYDKRFFDDDLANKVIGYYDAIQKKDGELFKSVVFPLYHDYQMKTVYEDKITEQQLMETTYDTIKEYFGYDFEFSYLNIDECVYQDGISGERDTLKQFLDDLSEQNGGKKISEDTQKLYELSVTRHTAKQGSGDRTETPDKLESERLYAIQYQNEWYIMYS